MIVVVVAQKDEGNSRQIVEAYAGRPESLRPGEGDGTGSLAPDRIGEDVAGRRRGRESFAWPIQVAAMPPAEARPGASA